MPKFIFNESAPGISVRTGQKPRRLLSKGPAGCLVWSLALLVAAAAFVEPLSAAIPKITLATTPLGSAPLTDKPSMTLALSVEYPTVGAQYAGGGYTDDSYDPAKEYIGYFDTESCYTYVDNPTERVTAPNIRSDYKRFDRTAAATDRKCSNAFSGNFMNWASSSAIDMLRLALSGGDRYIDTAGLTILQRAVISSDSPCMWNSEYFPAKKLKKDGGGTKAYWGAVPDSMKTDANGNDIYVANMLNRIYFGTSQNPIDCSRGNTSQYKLGSTSGDTRNSTNSDLKMGDRVNKRRFLPESAVYCPNVSDNCYFERRTKEVWYGAGTYWTVGPAYQYVPCKEAVLGNPNNPNPNPYDPPKCYIKDYTGDWSPFAPVSTVVPLNSDGFFYARVQVCKSSSGNLEDTRSYDFCKKYPGGNYKPTGVIQKYSEQMRLAAFGYLLDNNLVAGGRVGGVLRAPMKYVGAKAYNKDGIEIQGENPKAEWDSQTGVFKPNPDGMLANQTYWPAISGVVNYLNKFGRTGPTPGLYKTFDPVGELHYEVLRYLQGLAPSPTAIAGVLPPMADGFPYYDRWTDPYGDQRPSSGNYACVKSNIVVIGDIGTHDGSGRLPQPDAAKNVPDIAYWRGVVQNFERNTVGSYPDGENISRPISNPNTPNSSVPYESWGSQIMGSAYWARTHDIRGTGWTDQPLKQRPGLRVKTFLFDVNERGFQNNPATRRNSNQFFMAAKYGGFETDPGNPGGKPYNTKGNPFQDQSGATNNDVWQKPGDPGEAGAYYFLDTTKPSPARAVFTAFDEIFNRSASTARSVAGGGMSTGSKITNGSVWYSAKFDTGTWTGDVVAEPINQDASHALVVGAPRWSAAQKLDAMSGPDADRKIFVGGGGSGVAAEFKWNKISAALKAHLNRPAPGAAMDSLGEDRLAFLRGKRSKEGNPFRVRRSLLGDIVNSNVSYSGAPSRKFSGAGYTDFRNQYESRTPAVFAGANDGMLHAFNAGTGDELFAYIPSWLVPKLSALTDKDYDKSHQNYVDAPSVVAEAQVGTANALASDWKTVLVSGTGGGGYGVFALDVSDPAQFGTGNAMWEFTRADDPDFAMGQVVGAPKIMKIRTDGDTETPVYRWFAVVGSGVNNYVADSDGRLSSTGQPALFLLALDKPASTPWSAGVNYFKILLPLADASRAGSDATGLTNFSALYDSNGAMTDIYMGDLHGALWRLQFAKKPTAKWNMNQLSFFYKGDAASPVAQPLYLARTADDKVQPIFAAPTAFPGPIADGKESFYLVFGTGKYLEPTDSATTVQQTVYAVYDNGKPDADSSTGTGVISGRGRLLAMTFKPADNTISSRTPIKWGRPASDDDVSQRSGWYFDLRGSGERIDNAALDLGGLSGVINSKIPNPGSTGNSCSNAPGGGNQYFLNISNGAGAFVPSALGMLGPPVLLAGEGDVQLTPMDSTGRRIRKTTMRRFSQAQGGIDTSAPPVTTEETIGRLSWRQIFNYQDMKNAP